MTGIEPAHRKRTNPGTPPHQDRHDQAAWPSEPHLPRAQNRPGALQRTARARPTAAAPAPAVPSLAHCRSASWAFRAGSARTPHRLVLLNLRLKLRRRQRSPWAEL